MKQRLIRLAPICYLLVTIAVIYSMHPNSSYNDPDTFWHIELGTYMIHHGTVLHHAIHTFHSGRLPYIPHEFGFQIIIAALYQTFGWPGTYLLTAVCLLFLITGLYRLTRISRKEMGLDEHHFVLFLFALAVSAFIYYFYFTTRPQMISSFLIVWFFVFLREYQLKPSAKYIALMTAISLLIANIHAGVWLVIAVFTGMAIIEAVFARTLTRRGLLACLLILAAGFVNVGGISNLLYIFTVTRHHFNLSINEWQPVNFSSPTSPRTILLLLFVTILPFCLHKKLFRFMFMLGILFLGISSYKQNLFMWLFMPYFMGTVIDGIPYVRSLNIRYSGKLVLLGLLIGLSINTFGVFHSPPQVNVYQYPVDEMNYIMHKKPPGIRPKVLAKYGSSGYVMFRGGDVLCDGRQDPFIVDKTKGVFGWTAFERSINGFSVNLPDIVNYDRPDYVIVTQNQFSRLFRGWVSSFGEPVFTGRNGSVFLINKQFER